MINLLLLVPGSWFFIAIEVIGQYRKYKTLVVPRYIKNLSYMHHFPLLTILSESSWHSIPFKINHSHYGNSPQLYHKQNCLRFFSPNVLRFWEQIFVDTLKKPFINDLDKQLLFPNIKFSQNLFRMIKIAAILRCLLAPLYLPKAEHNASWVLETE